MRAAEPGGRQRQPGQRGSVVVLRIVSEGAGLEQSAEFVGQHRLVGVHWPVRQVGDTKRQRDGENRQAWREGPVHLYP